MRNSKLFVLRFQFHLSNFNMIYIVKNWDSAWIKESRKVLWLNFTISNILIFNYYEKTGKKDHSQRKWSPSSVCLSFSLSFWRKSMCFSCSHVPTPPPHQLSLQEEQLLQDSTKTTFLVALTPFHAFFFFSEEMKANKMTSTTTRLNKKLFQKMLSFGSQVSWLIIRNSFYFGWVHAYFF